MAGGGGPSHEGWAMKGARVQTSCSWGLQAPPALTLPLSEADVNARGREAEGALLWLNQVPVEKGSTQELRQSGGLTRRAREMEPRVAKAQWWGRAPPT